MRINKQQNKRNFDTILEDMLWPDIDLENDPEKSQRHFAIYTVLVSIPDQDYEALKERVQSFEWFIPDKDVRGFVRRWHAQVYPPEKAAGNLQELPYVDMLYLSPQLERMSLASAIAVTAHELAHIVLGHDLFPDAQKAPRQEDEAWELVRRWGYEKEVRLHQKTFQRRERQEAKREAKLKAEYHKASTGETDDTAAGV